MPSFFFSRDTAIFHRTRGWDAFSFIFSYLLAPASRPTTWGPQCTDSRLTWAGCRPETSSPMLLVRWNLRVPLWSADNSSRERSMADWRDLAGEGREVRPATCKCPMAMRAKGAFNGSSRTVYEPSGHTQGGSMQYGWRPPPVQPNGRARRGSWTAALPS